MKNQVKEYIKMMPLIVYPYIYLVFLLLISISLYNSSEAAYYICVAVAVIYNILTLVTAVMYSVNTAMGKRTAYQAAKMIFAVKALQIPAYIFHFMVGLAGSVMSVWGIGLILWAVLIDVLTIALTGTAAVGLCILMCKEKKISKGRAVLQAVSGYIFCVDVIAAIINVRNTKSKPS